MEKGTKILYVCQQAMPYLSDNEVSRLCRQLPQLTQEKGAEIRTFMPRFGSINERRNQLHEVIRLSGMNIIIDDKDHQLIIKVASIPAARMQVYFIDNDDFFNRKFDVIDAEGKLFEDNDERSIFFTRGIIETTGKLRWSPDIVHCHGWFSAIMPVYIKRLFADNPLFANSKVIISLYDDHFDGEMDANLYKKLIGEGVGSEDVSILETPTYVNLMKFALQYADGVVMVGKNIDTQILDFIKEKGIEVVDASNMDVDSDGNLIVDSKVYTDLYSKILGSDE